MTYSVDKSFLENDRTFSHILKSRKDNIRTATELNRYLKRLFDKKHLSTLYVIEFTENNWDIKNG